MSASPAELEQAAAEIAALGLSPGAAALAEKLREGDPDRFMSALFAPPARLEALITLYAFNLEIARTPLRVSEPQIGAIRLRWWLDAVEEIYADKPPRQHEIVAPLAALIRDTHPSARPPKALFDGLIEARLRDLDPGPMADMAGFEAHIAATAGALVRLAAWTLLSGRETPEIAETAEDAGFAFGVAAAFRATPALAARNRLMLPPLGGERIETARVLQGETTEALRRAIRRLARHGMDRLRAARARRGAVPKAARAAFLAGWRSDAVLGAAAKPDVEAFRDFGDESPFRRRAGLLWRGWTGRW